jgi:hypothetical protein
MMMMMMMIYLVIDDYSMKNSISKRKKTSIRGRESLIVNALLGNKI